MSRYQNKILIQADGFFKDINNHIDAYKIALDFA